MIDQSTDFGARVARRLQEDSAIWLTTVAADGTPHPTPVWFAWDGDSTIFIYSQPNQAKLRRIARNSRSSLNLDGNRHGGNIVILHGDTEILDGPPADRMTLYLEKYQERIPAIGQKVEGFAALFAVPLRFRITRVLGH